MIWEPGRELPIGFSKKDVLGLDAHRRQLRVLPHRDVSDLAGVAARDRARRRDVASSTPQAFSRFLEAAAADPRFNASDMLAEIGKIGKLSWTESLNYRVLLIPGTRRALRRHRKSSPGWTRGRTGAGDESIR